MNDRNLKDPKIDELERRINEVSSKIENLNVSSSQESNQIKAGEEKFKELVQALKEAQPSWEKDGGGVRGMPPAITPSQQSTLPDIPKFEFRETKPERGMLEDEPEVTQEVTQEVLQGGGGTTCIGLALYTKTNESGNSEVWIDAGTVNGQLPSGFDPLDGKFLASSGDGQAWIEVEIDQQTGEITSIDFDVGSSTPSNTDTKFYYALGYYEYVNNSPRVTNYGCGSVSVTFCRNWFVAEPPYFTVNISR